MSTEVIFPDIGKTVLNRASVYSVGTIVGLLINFFGSAVLELVTKFSLIKCED